MVVEVEFNGTNKTTLRSEWGGAPKKRKKMKKGAEKTRKQNLTEPTFLEITGFLVLRETTWLLKRDQAPVTVIRIEDSLWQLKLHGQRATSGADHSWAHVL